MSEIDEAERQNLNLIPDPPPTQPLDLPERPMLQQMQFEAAVLPLIAGDQASRELYAHFGVKSADDLAETDWREFIRLAKMSDDDRAEAIGSKPTAPPPIAVEPNGNTTITMRDEAVALAKMGFRIFPVKKGTKAPAQPPSKLRPPKGQYHQRIPSRDPADVGAMWTGPGGESLSFDIGINTEGLLVLDIDDKGKRTGRASFEALIAHHGLDTQTVVASTPSGGKHYFYKLPTDVDPTTVGFGSDKLGSGIDHRSYNSLVVAPGTKRADGEYRWVRSPAASEMKEAPRSLVELCQRSRERKPHDPLVVPGFDVDQPDAVERFRQFAINEASEAVSGAGGRNDTIALLRRAGDYGLMAATAMATLCEPKGWNETKAHPPWDHDELLELAESLEPSRDRPIGCDHASSQFDRVELEEEDRYTEGDKETPTNNDKRKRPLPFWSFDPDEAPAPKGWLIKDVAAKGETAGWIGPPGSGKSAVVLDWIMHCAVGRDWRGHKCKQQAASVYFAFERANLTRRRIKAYAQRWGLKTVPLAVVSRMLDLMDPATVPVILDTIKSVEDCYGMPVGSIAFDTLPKGIAAGGGDENSAKDVNRAAANLRRIHDARSLHIAVIGHTGKDPSKGSRGSNANQGDWDVEFQIYKKANGIKLVRVEKANDQDEGDLTPFQLHQLKIGVGEDLEDIVTSIVSENIPTLAADAKNSRETLSDRQALALRALSDCLERHGKAPPAHLDLADGLVCDLQVWRDALFSRGIVERRDNGTHRKEFQRLHQGLERKGRIGVQEEFVWTAANNDYRG